jgi:hypothetical protein
VNGYPEAFGISHHPANRAFPAGVVFSDNWAPLRWVHRLVDAFTELVRFTLYRLYNAGCAARRGAWPDRVSLAPGASASSST